MKNKEKLYNLILSKLSNNPSEKITEESLKLSYFVMFSREELIDACTYLYKAGLISSLNKNYSEGEVYYFIAQGITNEGIIYLKESSWYYHLWKKLKILLSFIIKLR